METPACHPDSTCRRPVARVSSDSSSHLERSEEKKRMPGQTFLRRDSVLSVLDSRSTNVGERRGSFLAEGTGPSPKLSSPRHAPNVGLKRTNAALLIDSPARSSYSRQMTQIFQHAGTAIRKENCSLTPRKLFARARNLQTPSDSSINGGVVLGRGLRDAEPIAGLSVEVLPVFKGDSRYPSPPRNIFKSKPAPSLATPKHEALPDRLLYPSDAPFLPPVVDKQISAVQHWLDNVPVPAPAHSSEIRQSTNQLQSLFPHPGAVGVQSDDVEHAVDVNSGYVADTDSNSFTNTDGTNKENLDPHRISPQGSWESEENYNPSPAIRRRNGIDLSNSPERRKVLEALQLELQHRPTIDPVVRRRLDNGLLSENQIATARQGGTAGIAGKGRFAHKPAWKDMFFPPFDREQMIYTAPGTLGETNSSNDTAVDDSSGSGVPLLEVPLGTEPTRTIAADARPTDLFALFPDYSRQQLPNPPPRSSHHAAAAMEGVSLSTPVSRRPPAQPLAEGGQDVKPLTPEVEKFRKGDRQRRKLRRCPSYWDEDIVRCAEGADGGDWGGRGADDGVGRK